MLARLPVTPVDLTDMPDEVSRQLFEALRLEMTYDHEHHQVAARITLTGDTIATVSRTTEAVVLPFRPQAAQLAANAPGPHGSAWCPQRDYIQNRAGATCDPTDGRLVIERAFPAARDNPCRVLVSSSQPGGGECGGEYR